MQQRYRILSAILMTFLAILTTSPAPAETGPATVPAPASQPDTTPPGAPRPADSQPAVTPERVRSLVEQAMSEDAIEAADAVVQLKFLARDGVPVWESMKPTDLPSVRGLLTWLKENPGKIHRPSPLRPKLEMMNVYIVNEQTGEARLMSGADLVEYGWLARELIRDGDPYGYWAIIDVAQTSTEILGRTPDPVTFTYVMPYLDRHLDFHLVLSTLKEWKGYWAKPMTKKREFPHPFFRELPLEPTAPSSPWSISTSLLLKSLGRYQAELERLGLWQTPIWEVQYTSKMSTPELLEAMASANFPSRQHISRLIRERLDDPAQRDLLGSLDGRRSLRQLVLSRPTLQSARLARDAARLLAFGLVKQLRGELPRAEPLQLAKAVYEGVTAGQ